MGNRKLSDGAFGFLSAGQDESRGESGEKLVQYYLDRVNDNPSVNLPSAPNTTRIWF